MDNDSSLWHILKCRYKIICVMLHDFGTIFFLRLCWSSLKVFVIIFLIMSIPTFSALFCALFTYVSDETFYYLHLNKFDSFLIINHIFNYSEYFTSYSLIFFDLTKLLINFPSTHYLQKIYFIEFSLGGKLES